MASDRLQSAENGPRHAAAHGGVTALIPSRAGPARPEPRGTGPCAGLWVQQWKQACPLHLGACATQTNRPLEAAPPRLQWRKREGRREATGRPSAPSWGPGRAPWRKPPFSWERQTALVHGSIPGAWYRDGRTVGTQRFCLWMRRGFIQEAGGERMRAGAPTYTDTRRRDRRDPTEGQRATAREGGGAEVTRKPSPASRALGRTPATTPGSVLGRAGGAKRPGPAGPRGSRGTASVGGG